MELRYNMVFRLSLVAVVLLGVVEGCSRRPPPSSRPLASCTGRCGQLLVDQSAPCQCNRPCTRYNDCCPDHGDLCLQVPQGLESCKGRCGDRVDNEAPCQCNDACTRFGDCCDDYQKVCHGQTNPTDSEIKELSEQLWALDDNRLPDSDIEVDTTPTDRFITYVDEKHFSKPTYAAFIKLMDNYIAKVGVPDPHPCDVCKEEEEAFLSAIINTPLMRTAWNFLSSRGYASANETDFKAELSQYWFYKFSRSKGPLDSCGFEHVFLGQLKATTVSGFHNWVQFHAQEKEGELDYKTYLEGCQPSLHVTSFEWQDRNKKIGSLFVGTSPEFEMAVYTVCFLTRTNQGCRLSLNGNQLNIISYTMSGVSTKTVGTAYPDCL